jgi:hypothetical protein
MPKRDLDPDYLARVAELPCVICKIIGTYQANRTEVHHKLVPGMGIRASDYDTMPLCVYHHRTGKFGEAVHNGTKSFEAKYGIQDDHIKETQRKLGYEPTN